MIRSLFFFILLSGWLYGQKNPPKNLPAKVANGYKISLNTKGLKGKTLYLSLYSGNAKKVHKIDSATVQNDEQKIEWIQSKKILPIVVKLSIKSSQSEINLAIDNGNLIQINIYGEDLKKAQIISNPLNIDFLKFQNTESLETKNEMLLGFTKKYPKTALEIYSLLEYRKNTKNNFSKDQNGVKQFLKNFNKNSKSISLMPNSFTFLNSYFSIMELNNANYTFCINELLGDMDCNSPNYIFYINWIAKNLELNESKDMASTYEYLLENYLKKSPCSKKYENIYTNHLYKLNYQKSLKINSKMNDFYVVDLNNENKLFSNVYANKNTFIIFYDPTCVHCQIEIPELVKYFDQLKKTKNVDVTTIAFNSNVDYKDWSVFVQNYGLKDWINIKPNMESLLEYNKLSITSIPTFVLLNKEGNIVSKTNDKFAIEKLLSN